jgi:hypothetical protein
MSKRCAILICTIALVGCEPSVPSSPEAREQPAQGDRGQTASARAEAEPDTSPEHLLAEPPTGWRQAFHSEGPAMRMVEFVPPDTAEEWTDKVSFESFSDQPLPDPIELLKSIAADQRKTCDRFSDHDTFSGLENDYPTSVRLFICYSNPLTGKGQVTLVKTIKGDSHFYVITRAKRVAPIDASADAPDAAVAKAVAEWSTYLHAISLCNDADERHPCPSASSATGSTSQSE